MGLLIQGRAQCSMAMALSTMRMAVFDSFLADSHRRANPAQRLDVRQGSTSADRLAGLLRLFA
ncbi:hypothetical protein BC89_02495 [Pseudomonas monteilii]|nr:hypothetical protein BC89_02495 [Pseudomonas monteilii]